MNKIFQDRDYRKRVEFYMQIVRTICAICAVTLTAIWVAHQIGLLKHF